MPIATYDVEVSEPFTMGKWKVLISTKLCCDHLSGLVLIDSMPLYRVTLTETTDHEMNCTDALVKCEPHAICANAAFSIEVKRHGSCYSEVR